MPTECAAHERIPAGQRHQRLRALAASLYAAGLDSEAVTEILLAVNEALCDPRLPDEEVEGITC